MADPVVKMYDIMACNVYWDFDDSPLQNEQHKFLVSFFPTPGVPTPELIERITAYGPGGYSVQFAAHKMFTVSNRNGWIYDPTLNYYWYMLNMATGYMREGEYTIEVKCKSGEVLKMSRVQRNAPGEAAIAAYKKNKGKILESYDPSRVRPFERGSLTDVKLSWSTLADLGGPDAFYVTRLNEGSSTIQADVQKLVWWDNIYIQRIRTNDPKAGENRGEVTVTTELKPKTSYAYFVEITDGNVQRDANYCIFQPHQIFTTP